MRKGRYFPKIKWNEIDPLDGKLVTDMAECESQTMRMVERIKRIQPANYENRRNYYIQNLRYWSHVLLNHKINAFYRCAPPHEGYDNIIAHLCEYYGIPAYYGNPFHTFNGQYRYFARNVKDNFPGFNNEIIGSETKLINPLKNLLDVHWNKKKPTIHPVVVPEKKRKTQKTLLRRNKTIIAYYNSKCVVPNFSKPYIYFPLHYQYEATTCPMGGPFVDQHLAIEILSRLGIQIYVKEHPRISKNRNMAYYVKLLRMKNVNFVSMKANNYALIDNAFAVATITGTSGWEAVLRGKPSFIFGGIHYQYAPGVFKIDSLADAISAFIEAKEFKPNKKLVEDYLLKLQGRLFKHTTKDIVNALKTQIDEDLNYKGFAKSRLSSKCIMERSGIDLKTCDDCKYIGTCDLIKRESNFSYADKIETPTEGKVTDYEVKYNESDILHSIDEFKESESIKKENSLESETFGTGE